ncbi:hypothetical protein GGS21DRAFT_316607 [Xylaria nigripes]|nr:hypothetical protein GGS21DRAFT_316607 [Xylaria nigripes]
MNMQFCTQGYASSYGFPQGQGSTMTYAEPQYSLHPSYPGLQYMYGYQTHRPPMMADRGGLCDGKTESKPRLSKEEVEKLEKVFQENPKPSSSVKAQLADGLGLERPRINNWFQNRRAKAKQERKQEEYEARRAAEKSASEPTSPDEDASSGTTDSLREGSRKLSRSSSAAFPQVSSPSQTADASQDENDEDDEHEDVNEIITDRLEDANSVCVASSVSPHTEIAESFHSPLPVEFPQSDAANFTQNHNPNGYLQTRSMSDYGLFSLPMGHGSNTVAHDQNSEMHHGLSSRMERSMSTEAYTPQHYNNMHATSLPSASAATVFFSPVSNNDTCDVSENPFDASASPESSHGVEGMPTPTDSFRSPPPPANIASRRNIPRPATLQAASLRSRSFNMPKTGLEGSKRMDMTSPVSSMRRISSATGLGQGRIQKSSSGPRSPYFGRNAEALLQYHNNSRSPVNSNTPPFPGAAPPTPMTPALFEHSHGREPVVMSASPEDNSFLGVGVAPQFVPEIKEEHELKTPPTTPGMMADYGTRYVNNTFNSGFNITDQPLLTPFFNSEFPDLTIHHVPAYVETSEADPTTPVYASMMGSNGYNSNVMTNTQFDWETNESVISSRSSPGYAKSKQIQFTPNMTPQDYH